jgi:hypothetical protein
MIDNYEINKIEKIELQELMDKQHDKVIKLGEVLAETN